MKTHWKKLKNPNYLGAYSLDIGSDKTVTIQKVVKEVVTGAGGIQEECTVLHLKGSKPMILNATNAKTIQRLYNTPFIEEWVGKKITLFASKTKFKGEMVECLRIREKAHTKSKPTISNDRFAKAIQSIKNKTYSIEDLKSKFELSSSQISVLNGID